MYSFVWTCYLIDALYEGVFSPLHSIELFKIFFSLLTLSTAFLQKACGPGKKYLGVLDGCLWPTVQRYFAGGGYIFQEDKAQGEFGEKALPGEKYCPHLMANVFSRLVTDR